MDERKETLSFFIYMWNAWSNEESIKIFGEDLGNHIWNKYVNNCEWHGSDAAITLLVKELSEGYLHLLVERACSLFVGRHNK